MPVVRCARCETPTESFIYFSDADLPLCERCAAEAEDEMVISEYAKMHPETLTSFLEECLISDDKVALRFAKDFAGWMEGAIEEAFARGEI